MVQFSAVAAATEGFRLMRDRPKAVAIWAGFYVAFTVVVIVMALLLFGGAIMALMSSGMGAAGAGPPDLATLGASIGAMVLFALLLIPLYLIFTSMLYAAVQRAVLRPEDGGVGFLKLGGDEFRFLGLMLLYLLVLLAGYAVAALLIFVLYRLHPAVGVLGGLAAFCGLVYVYTRLSLAMPMTFSTRRIDLFGSWALTRGKFWSMLGAYLLAGLIMIAVIFGVSLVFGIVLGVVMVAAGGSAMMAAGEGDAAATGAVFGTMAVIQIINVLVQAVLGAVTVALTASVPAAIYRDLAMPKAADVF